MFLRVVLLGILLLSAPTSAHAHPHEWVDVASEVLFDKQDRIAAIRHHWRFDEAFTSFAIQGLDGDGDGAYSPEELKPLAQENVESLGDFDFFTFISVGDYTSGFAAPTDYHLDYEGGRLTLHFTLPLAQPLFSTSKILLQVYDPEYYIAFTVPSSEAVRLVGAPSACRLAVYPARAPDAAAAAALATVGPDQRELPAELQALASGIDNSAEIHCGAQPAASAAQGQASGPATANEAVAQFAVPGAQEGDLRQLPTPAAAAAQPAAAQPAADDPAGPNSARPRAPPTGSDGFAARLGALQTGFNRQLTEALKGLKTDGSAFWWLGGVSFLYGIVHAAGPGHGKVVISSYLVANEQRVRRGIAIAFISALVQAMVAIGLVTLMAMLLDMTSMAITSTARLFEAGSFALVAALGAYLLVRKGRAAWALARGGDPHGGHHHHHHHHHHAAHRPRGSQNRAEQISGIRWEEPTSLPPHASELSACSCGHAAPPAALEKPGLSGAAAAVLSVGIRPCTGALVVLVFALAQGVFWAGIASTFLMGLGTAITVAALAAIAVGAKDLAGRWSRGDDRRAAKVMLGLELAAALFITALGAVLLVGALSA